MCLTCEARCRARNAARLSLTRAVAVDEHPLGRLMVDCDQHVDPGDRRVRDASARGARPRASFDGALPSQATPGTLRASLIGHGPASCRRRMQRCDIARGRLAVAVFGDPSNPALPCGPGLGCCQRCGPSTSPRFDWMAGRMDARFLRATMVASPPGMCRHRQSGIRRLRSGDDQKFGSVASRSPLSLATTTASLRFDTPNFM